MIPEVYVIHVECFSSDLKAGDELVPVGGDWFGDTMLREDMYDDRRARSSDVQCIVVAMNLPCFSGLSTINRIASKNGRRLESFDEVLEIEFQGRSGRGCFNSP